MVSPGATTRDPRDDKHSRGKGGSQSTLEEADPSSVDEIVEQELGATAAEGDDPGAVRDDIATGKSGQTGQKKSSVVDTGSSNTNSHIAAVANTSAGTESGTGASGPGKEVEVGSDAPTATLSKPAVKQ